MTTNKLKQVAAAVLAILTVACAVGLWTAHSTRASEPAAFQAAPAGKGDPALIKRGAYLVNDVARCGDCHTPRNARGGLDMTRHLQGATMWFTPKVKGRGEWENRAPDITVSGRGGRWTEARMIKFLSTGQKSDPPMPAYKLTTEDAQAVTAYLRSLSGRKGEGRGEREREGKGKRKRRERER
jgi:mono/diheme cytochrome c family protein